MKTLSSSVLKQLKDKKTQALKNHIENSNSKTKDYIKINLTIKIVCMNVEAY